MQVLYEKLIYIQEELLDKKTLKSYTKYWKLK